MEFINATMEWKDECKCKVIVVGAGLAGASAVIEAARAGASVLLIEKEERLGGNSAKATSGINGVCSAAQVAKGIDDSVHDLSNDTIKSGGGLSIPHLVELLSNHSIEAITFLEAFGLQLDVLSQCGGHSRPRTHRLPETPDGRPVPVGFTTMKTLCDYIEKEMSSQVVVEKGASVTRLLTTESNGQVTVVGVEYLKKGSDLPVEVLADAVVLTTGGFAFDKSPDSLMAEFAPHVMQFATTNGPHALGEGIKLARSVGANLVNMDKVQIHPTGLVKPADPCNPVKFLAPEAMRGCGGILLNSQGQRFCNELDTRDKVTEMILGNCAPYPVSEELLQEGGPESPKSAYMVMNDAVATDFGLGVLGFYAKMGLVQKFDNAAGLEAMLGCPDNTISETLNGYTSAANSGVADSFGKTVFPVKEFDPSQPLHVAVVTPCIHYCMGGAQINGGAEIQAMTPEGTKSIKGLFGAGEVTGGVHGANRLAGNSLLECVVFGRIAGQRAACTKLHLSSPPLSAQSYTQLKLRSKRRKADSHILELELPSPYHSLELEPEDCISIRFTDESGQVVTLTVQPKVQDFLTTGVLHLEISDGDVQQSDNLRWMVENTPVSVFLEVSGPHKAASDTK